MALRGKSHAKSALLLAIIVGVGALSWWLVGRSRPLAADPLGRVPGTATAVAWIDTGALLGSPLWDRIVRARGGDEGIRRLERSCGFDPIARLTDVVLFATGDETDRLDRVGVVARGDLDHEALVECVSKVVEDDGGEVRRVSIEGVSAVAGRGSSRAAFIGTDGIVAGSEPLVREVIGVTQGDAEPASEDETLARLWRRVAGGRHIVLVAHVPGPWRDAARRIARENDRDSLAELAGARAIGAGVRVTRGFGAGVALEMRSEEQARAAEAAVRAEIDRALDQPMIALSPLAPALRRIDFETQNAELILTVELSTSQVDDLVDLAEELWERSDEQARRRAAPAEPDEIIR